MTGYLLAALLWYAVTTVVAAWGAAQYNRWLSSEDLAANRLLPTSMLVVWGVAGTEALRILRLAPLAIVVGKLLGWGGVSGLLLLAALVFDAASAYLATGIPMIQGDLRREAVAREAAEATAIQRMRRTLRNALEAGQDGDSE